MYCLVRMLLALLVLRPIQASAAAAWSVLEDKPVRLPPVKSCRVLSNITSAEFHALKNLNQLIQAKMRRANELQQFIRFKEHPSNDTAMIAMWSSIRSVNLLSGLARHLGACPGL
jgi:hypothetical protein